MEAAFQHQVWEPRMPEILELARTWIVLCSADGAVAARRHLQRGYRIQTGSFITATNVLLITGKQARFHLPTVIQRRNSMDLQFKSRQMKNTSLVLMRLR